MEAEYSCELVEPKNVFPINDDNIVYIRFKNNGLLNWPENDTKLICNKKKSPFFFNETKLPPLKIGEDVNIRLDMIIPNGLEWKTYKIYLNFNVKGKNYGDEIMVYMNGLKFRNNFYTNNNNSYKENNNYRENDYEFDEQEFLESYRKDDCRDYDDHVAVAEYFRSDYG